ncbi:DUF255 domain-containing protein [uncultured Thiomicrorhabdus sp.]
MAYQSDGVCLCFSKTTFTLLYALALSFVGALLQTADASPLKNHPSPYLAMHSDDPVHWQRWNRDTLKQAQKQNKLILLSSGYFSCHWCHVMQQEVYQNPQSATLINQLFVSIKIDRELHPLVDSQMIDFARKYRGSAGWPQHVILTPDAKPFAAFTYLPNDKLQTYLRNVDKLWKNDKTVIKKLAESAILQPQSVNIVWDPEKFKTALYAELQNVIDDFSGGLQGTSKFPKTPLLLALIQQNDLPETLSDWLQLTLKQMAQQHLFDHLYGGFYRYTVDPEWQEPHFEKMLYDNALLLELYLHADMRWPEQGFAKTADATLGYLRQQLYSPQLQLYLGSQSAIDATGNEGGDYLFSKGKLRQLLKKQALTQVEQQWLNQAPKFALGYHPKPTEQHWSEIKQQLLAARPIPKMAIDDKAIVSWNGLLLNALAQANIWLKQNPVNEKLFNLQNAKQWGQELANTLLAISQQQQIPRSLIFTDNQSTALIHANLEDLAYLWQGLNAWQTATQKKIDLVNLQKQIQPLLSANGWQDPQSLALYPLNHGVTIDDAVPSVTAILGCDFGKLQIDQNDFYKKAINYASYLNLSQCE